MRDAVQAALTHSTSIMRLLGEQNRAKFADLLRSVVDADPIERDVQAVKLIRFLGDVLPIEHEVRRALIRPGTSLGSSGVVIDDDLDAQFNAVVRSLELETPAAAEPPGASAGRRPPDGEPAGPSASFADRARELLDAWPDDVPGRELAIVLRGLLAAEPPAEHPVAASTPAAPPPGDDAEPDPELDDLIARAKAALLAVPSVTPSELAAAGQDPGAPGLIRLPSGTDVRLPAFQFDASRRPHPVVVQVNELLGADADPWGVASWWLDGNTWLDAAPAEIVGAVDDADIIAAARTLLEEV